MVSPKLEVIFLVVLSTAFPVRGLALLPDTSFALDVSSPLPQVYNATAAPAHAIPASLGMNPGATPEQIQKGKEILQRQGAQKKIPAEAIEESQEDLQEESQEKSADEPPESNLPPATPEEDLSTFEAYMQGKIPLTVSMDVNQFGYDLFDHPPSTFAPVDTVPVGPDYLLGPGDEIKISLWGKVNAEYSSIIDSDGKISLPQIGILHLSGLTFSGAKDTLENEFSRYYRPEEVKMNVSTGRLRSIRIFAVGRAHRPGSYTLSSLSTLINALFAAGGPGKNGTMRDIQLKRNGGVPLSILICMTFS